MKKSFKNEIQIQIATLQRHVFFFFIEEVDTWKLFGQEKCLFEIKVVIVKMFYLK